ncbi:hypothetical protein N7492_001900 [Penicillium capsulatum]|uniref:Rhodopsin domain-containing protein n=1 Tax=Penicillium capsulatum TaxID=69766 RepID=A0A9W9LV70_9EURO|nr:hypothetical protein N7492_001900 [Penicillium capsulatum]KAJ6123477.1 hypothetical protein N7512_005942 [Penicillium capsulatum]
MDPLIRAIFGEPPAGINLTESRVNDNNRVVITMLCLAAVAVLLRFMSRLFLRNPFKADDWLVVGSLIALSATAALSIAGGKVGNGKHIWVATAENVELIYKYLFAYILIYAGGVTCTRISILCFYHRVFSPMEPWFRWVTVLGWFVTATYPIYMWAGVCADCRPITHFWTRFTGSEGTCLNETKFLVATAAINMGCDFIVCLIPIPRILQLQMNKKLKIAICCVMAVGFFVCIASVVRIYYISVFMTGPDGTWLMGPVFIWSTIEPALALTCACMPHLTPLAKVAHYTVVSTLSKQRSKFSSVDSSMPYASHDSGTNKSTQGTRRSTLFTNQPPTLIYGFGTSKGSEDEIGLTSRVEVGTPNRSSFFGSHDQLADHAHQVHVHSSFEQTTKC